MRISSSQYFNMNVSAMSDQQSTLASMYQQIASGKRILTASDDPLGAAQAVQLTMKTSAITQFTTNQTTALSSLQQEDSTLGTVASVLTKIKTLAVSAGDGSLNDENRSAIGTQIAGLRSQLLGLANTTDGQGNYIFGGFKADSAPFSDNPTGVGASYTGDLGQRQIQISDGRTMTVADTGAAVFQSISASESSPVASATIGNSGTGTISAVSTTDTSAPSNATGYKIAFTVSGGVTQYSVTDSSGAAIASNVTYSGKTDIALGSGQKVTIDGAPANGDTFSVDPAGSSNKDVFSAIDNLVAALKQPTTTDAGQAALTNALGTASTQLSNSFNNVLGVQATVGGREQEVQAVQTSMADSTTQYQSDLADLTSINLVSAISQYELTQNALQGAQQAFTQIQKMSLFDYLS